MDPYYFQFYRVGLDGSGLRRLTPEVYDNQAAMSESGRFMVHTFSRVNAVPESVVRSADGEVVMDLQVADVSRLVEAGWQMPEPFTVKAGDGVTDLYGVMYKPFDFDSTKVYPIIEYVYPGPQTEAVAKSFNQGNNLASRFEIGLAQLGFVVVTVGNRGGHPSRSKWYHNYGYGNLRDYGLEDKKVTVEQLAQRHDFIDMDRVGIYGHSGGGFMSTAAMLVYPDFFKVAVSSSGNHTNDIYNRWWSEKHHGVKEVVKGDTVTFEYDIATNPEIAANSQVFCGLIAVLILCEDVRGLSRRRAWIRCWTTASRRYRMPTSKRINFFSLLPLFDDPGAMLLGQRNETRIRLNKLGTRLIGFEHCVTQIHGDGFERREAETRMVRRIVRMFISRNRNPGRQLTAGC